MKAILFIAILTAILGEKKQKGSLFFPLALSTFSFFPPPQLPLLQLAMTSDV